MFLDILSWPTIHQASTAALRAYIALDMLVYFSKFILMVASLAIWLKIFFSSFFSNWTGPCFEKVFLYLPCIYRVACPWFGNLMTGLLFVARVFFFWAGLLFVISRRYEVEFDNLMTTVDSLEKPPGYKRSCNWEVQKGRF